MSGIQGGTANADYLASAASTGVNTRPNVTAVTSIVLAANTNRRYASFFNQSGSVMYLNMV